MAVRKGQFIERDKTKDPQYKNKLDKKHNETWQM